MQEIQLTSDNNTIHVDDVDVSKGVYAVNPSGNVRYIATSGLYYIIHCAGSFMYKDDFRSLTDCIEYLDDFTFFTIPDNKRITTTKALTVDDLKDGDHVGFTTNCGKGYVAYTGDDKFHGIYTYQLEHLCNAAAGTDYQSTLKKVITDVFENAAVRYNAYKFHTRKDLYKWLAED